MLKSKLLDQGYVQVVSGLASMQGDDLDEFVLARESLTSRSSSIDDDLSLINLHRRRSNTKLSILIDSIQLGNCLRRDSINFIEIFLTNLFLKFATYGSS